MRRFSQSIHLNPGTQEGLEILSVLLAVPRYERGALIRSVLSTHIRTTASLRYPGLKPKTLEEIEAMLAARPARSRQRSPSTPVHAVSSPGHAPTGSFGGLSGAAPSALSVPDLEARLNQLPF